MVHDCYIVAGATGVGSQGIGPISAQVEHHHKVQGCPRKPHQRSVSLPTPTAAATEAGEEVGVGPQGVPQAEGGGAAAHQLADLVLHPFSALVLAGNIAFLTKASRQHVLICTCSASCNMN